MIIKTPFFSTVILPDEAGLSAGTILRRRYGFSKTLIRQVKQKGTLLINGKKAFFNERPGAWNKVETFLNVETKVTPEFEPLEIVFEDEVVLVVNKPAGQVMHPRRSYVTGTLANHVAGHLLNQGLGPSSFLINRLDKGTSGLVLVAKNPLAATVLSKQINTIEKHYLALVQGSVKEEKGVIDLGIITKEDTLKRLTGAKGKASLTEYEVLERHRGHTFILVKLRSGRTHQIRVHLSAIGHPIVGDDLYGKPNASLGRPFLHAGLLGFSHPKTGSVCRMESSLPIDLKQQLEKIKK